MVPEATPGGPGVGGLAAGQAPEVSKAGWAWRVVWAAQAVLGAAALARLAAGRERREALDARGAPPPEGRVAALVPARDEAGRIGPCLDGLGADPDLAEVLVVDDASRDATAAIARAAGARVLIGAPLPAGWAGKAWALQQGLEALEADWVLCVDADVRPRPGLARALVAAARAEGDDVLSAGLTARVATAPDAILHPAFTASLPYRLGVADARRSRPAGPTRPPRDGNADTRREAPVGATRASRDGGADTCREAPVGATRASREGGADTSAWVGAPAGATGRLPARRTLLNGQCVLVPRERLLAAGGLTPVAGSLVEDVALGRRLAARGWRVGFVQAGALAEIEGYPDARATWRGWGRSIALADVTPPVQLAAELATLALVLALPVLRLALGRPTRLDRALLTVRLALAASIGRGYRPRTLLVLLAPLADPLVAARCVQTALRPERAWRGRRYGPGTARR